MYISHCHWSSVWQPLACRVSSRGKTVSCIPLINTLRDQTARTFPLEWKKLLKQVCTVRTCWLQSKWVFYSCEVTCGTQCTALMWHADAAIPMMSSFSKVTSYLQFPLNWSYLLQVLIILYTTYIKYMHVCTVGFVIWHCIILLWLSILRNAPS